MRSEQEMMDVILGMARRDERIRAVYMNGSRTNPNVPRDIFQDYDIVYVVTEVGSFIQDNRWIAMFGDLIILQEPDKAGWPAVKDPDESTGYSSYGYLMLFQDGNRIDLHVQSKEAMLGGYLEDKLTVPLFDKDGWLPQIPPPTDVDYHVKPPTETEFRNCANEFWWCLQNVAKGIWRDELPYAKATFENPVRGSLDQMVSWSIGTKHAFQVSTGKMGKYFKRYLTDSDWQMYKATYSSGEPEDFWNSVFVACELFRLLAQGVADYFSFRYAMDDDRNMTAYLEHIRTLPKDAINIY